MASHDPDATALARSAFASPDDPTPRLVLADWLDDTGRPANVAWAEYIRRTATTGRVATGFDDRIAARLTLSVRAFVHSVPAVLSLLPPSRVTVRLASFVPARSVWDLVPESVAHENRLLPLVVMSPRTLILATPTNPDTAFVSRLEYVLNRRVLFVMADTDGIAAAVRRTWRWAEL